ncbi:MAG: 1-phosphofructokinase [Lachnospiraceae bacterium]|nr:1-phosphofructokinase [Lachnospiraceae bacterium]
MIYTVTLNPSLDYATVVNRFELHKTNRTSMEQLTPGGKGINVSAVLSNLGMKSVALGFAAGFTGRELVERVKKLGFASDFVFAKEGMTRINVKLLNYDGTEINGIGPEISKEELECFLRKLEELQEGDYLVLAGSSPKGVPDTIYRDILERLRGRNIQVVVDACGELLLNVLEYKPFLVKPNHHELGEIFQLELGTKEQVIPYARVLQERGAKNVLVSMGSQGAVLLDETGAVHEMDAPEGMVINSVGAGDSMVAGFLAGYVQTGDYEKAFRMGVAAGSATAFSQNLATAEQIKRLMRGEKGAV